MGITARVARAKTDLHIAQTNLLILYGKAAAANRDTAKHEAEVISEDCHRLQRVTDLLDEMGRCFN
jgi:hypothetical protein